MEIGTKITEIKSESDLWENLPDINSLKAITIDTETTGFDPYTKKPVLFQLGDNTRQYVIHWYKVPIYPLKKYLESPDIFKIFQNHKFDYKFIKVHGGIEIDNNTFARVRAGVH